MKIVMSGGHAKYVSGAVDILNEVFEARRVVSKVAEYLKKVDCDVVTFNDDTSKTQRDNINTIVKFHNSKKRDLDVSVHFNAGNTDEGGTEVLYVSDGNKALAAKVSKVIAEALEIKDRGAKKREDLGFLNGTKKPAILIEVCFVNVKENAEAYNKNFDKACQAIAEALSGKKIPIPKPTSNIVQKSSKEGSEGVTYRVVAGSFENKKRAEIEQAKLKKLGIETFLVAYKK